MAQQNKKAEINIATSAECTMCKKALETALLHQHGVKFAKYISMVSNLQSSTSIQEWLP